MLRYRVGACLWRAAGELSRFPSQHSAAGATGSHCDPTSVNKLNDAYKWMTGLPNRCSSVCRCLQDLAPICFSVPQHFLHPAAFALLLTKCVLFAYLIKTAVLLAGAPVLEVPDLHVPLQKRAQQAVPLPIRNNCSAHRIVGGSNGALLKLEGTPVGPGDADETSRRWASLGFLPERSSRFGTAAILAWQISGLSSSSGECVGARGKGTGNDSQGQAACRDLSPQLASPMNSMVVGYGLCRKIRVGLRNSLSSRR